MPILDEIEKIIDESGNSFHCKVTNFLKKKGWHTLVSPYYMDGATNKPREIDLIAEKYWNRKHDYGRGFVLLLLSYHGTNFPMRNLLDYSTEGRL
jgi:hypothetical protein